MRAILIIHLVSVITIVGIYSFGQSIPQTLTYQGLLTDHTSEEVPVEGQANMVFRIYDAEAGGNLLWSESWLSVPINHGFFTVVLGTNGSPIPLIVFASGSERYLELEINNEIMDARQKINSVGYSYQSESANNSEALSGITVVGWQRALSQSACPADQYLNGIFQDGTVLCSAPPVNYFAGTGLYMTGDDTFNVSYGSSSAAAIEGNDARINDWILSDSDIYSGVTGNVGIGTMNPQSTLGIFGNIRINDGTQNSGKVLTSHSAGIASWEPLSSVPQGMLLFFNLSDCPEGWTKVSDSQGRYLVALQQNGTLNGTAGTNLSDQENRATGQHDHSIGVVEHTHTFNGGASGGGSAYACSSPPGSPNTISGNWAQSSVSTTGITINAYGDVEGTNAPYIQLLLCQKN